MVNGKHLGMVVAGMISASTLYADNAAAKDYSPLQNGTRLMLEDSTVLEYHRVLTFFSGWHAELRVAKEGLVRAYNDNNEDGSVERVLVYPEGVDVKDAEIFTREDSPRQLEVAQKQFDRYMEMLRDTKSRRKIYSKKFFGIEIKDN